jgi:hypothetical protein
MAPEVGLDFLSRFFGLIWNKITHIYKSLKPTLRELEPGRLLLLTDNYPDT